MRSEVESKRNKFAKDIRMKHHEQYFQLQRQSHNTQLPTMVYLPIMLENQLYEDIDAIMDTIQLCQAQQASQPIINTIRQRYQHHNDTNIRVLMLKLLNRLMQWTHSDMATALNLIRQGREDMLKQLAVYLEAKYDKLSKNQKQQFQKLNKQIQQIFPIILPMNIINIDNRIFWLDIICRTLQLIPTSIDMCVKNIDNFMFAIDVGINNNNDFQLVRVFKIISQLSTIKECQQRIIQLSCFPTFLNMIDNGSIQLVVEGLEIVAQLMSADDVIVYKMVHQFEILKILIKYVDHIMIVVQSRVLWAISNITGSQNYTEVYNNKQLLHNIMNKCHSGTRPQIRMQAYFCVLNLICCCHKPDQIEYLIKNYNVIELLMILLRECRENNAFKDAMWERLAFSIYHMIEVYKKCKICFQSLGLKKQIDIFENQEKDQGKLKLIHSIQDLFSKVHI